MAAATRLLRSALGAAVRGGHLPWTGGTGVLVGDGVRGPEGGEVGPKLAVFVVHEQPGPRRCGGGGVGVSGGADVLLGVGDLVDPTRTDRRPKWVRR